MGSSVSLRRKSKQMSSSSSRNKVDRKLAGEGLNEDAFFDSKQWLDSDSEDDFLSVNGESTPFGGSSSTRTRRISDPILVDKFPDTQTEISPARSFGDILLRKEEGGLDGRTEDQNDDDTKNSHSQERTRNDDLNQGEEMIMEKKGGPSKTKHHHGCFPFFHCIKRKKHKSTTRMDKK